MLILAERPIFKSPDADIGGLDEIIAVLARGGTAWRRNIYELHEVIRSIPEGVYKVAY